MFFGGGFPFGDMPDGFSRGPRKEVDSTKFYDLLGVDKSSSVADVKKAYRKLAIKHHPDKGGDPEKFKEVSRAYEVLSDPEKRKVYDEYGEDGLENSGASDPTDIFEMFFGGGRSRKPQGKKRGEDMVSPIKVGLEQLYNGCVRKLAINRDVICEDCGGHGGPEDAIETCGVCNGSGFRVQIRQIGPMIQQSQSACVACKAQGKMMPEKKKCKKCMGTGVVKERKVLEVHVDKGAPDRHKITFSGESDEKPGEVPGDVVFVLDQLEHATFKRKGNHLIMDKKITLFEALTGYRFSVTHLDGRVLIIDSKPGEVTEPKSVKAVKGEGMPMHKNPFVRGDLYISFTVQFPTANNLALEGEKLKAALKKVLPLPPPLTVKMSDPDVEHYTVSDISLEDFHNAGNKEQYDEDDEDGGSGGQRVQCRQQ